MNTVGIFDRSIHDTPLAIVDLETTGLHPHGDRVVEIGVVRIEPGQAPEVAIDTLVCPGCRVSGTEIHGITDAQVEGAPRFKEIVGEFYSAISGCVLGAYNVYFDERFLRAELDRADGHGLPPHLCLMYMRPLLGLGGRCTLLDACREHGVSIGDAHVAADDAMSAAALWRVYLESMDQAGVRTFGDLAKLKAYKFTESFRQELLDGPPRRGPSGVRFKSRAAAATRTDVRRDAPSALSEYWAALQAALADLQVTPGEVAYLRRKQRELKLAPDDLRWLHARAFGAILSTATADRRIDENEVATIAQIAEALAELGWRPGDRVGTPTPVAPSASPPLQKGLIARLFGP